MSNDVGRLLQGYPFAEQRQQRLFGHCRGFNSAIAQRFKAFGANGREFTMAASRSARNVASACRWVPSEEKEIWLTAAP